MPGVAVVTTCATSVAPVWWLPAALVLPRINLASALLSHARLRGGGLLVLLHLALLGLIRLVGVGRLVRFNGRVEISAGSYTFSSM